MGFLRRLIGAGDTLTDSHGHITRPAAGVAVLHAGDRPSVVRSAGVAAVDSAEAPTAAIVAAGLLIPPLTLLGRTGHGQPLFAFAAPAEELMPWWQRLRNAHDRSGVWPVLLGPAEVSRNSVDVDVHRNGMQALAHACAVDVRLVLRRCSTMGGAHRHHSRPRPAEAFHTPARPGLVGLVRADEGWHVPALLSWAGAASCGLQGADVAAVLRRWQEQWGAELVALTDNTLELSVTRPPIRHADALAVASEQLAFCPRALPVDAGASGAHQIEQLAEGPVRSRCWTFTWCG